MPVNAESSMSIDQKIDQVLEPAANVAESVAFWSLPIGGVTSVAGILTIIFYIVFSVGAIISVLSKIPSSFKIVIILPTAWSTLSTIVA